MKKLLLPTAAIFFAVLFTSCKKNHDCECTYTDVKGNVTTETSVIKASKSSAKKACEKNADTWEALGADCKLK